MINELLRWRPAVRSRGSLSHWKAITPWIPGAAVAMIIISALSIVSTYRVFTHTVDEPIHIACGLEWWQHGTYTYEHQHPPLSRIAAAAGPWLLGALNVSRPQLFKESNRVLYDSRSYYEVLAAARAGELPFFLLAASVVWFWARRLAGNLAALLAVMLFCLTPPVLAHAGLATTDIALTGSLIAAMFALDLWLEQPSARRSVLLGTALAAGVLSKFTFLMFFPVVALFLLLARVRWDIRWGRLARMGGLAVLLAIFLIWAVYRFDFTPVTIHRLGFHGTNLPLGGLLQGILDARAHNSAGHTSYLFGERRETGWWYFFPAVLFVKTPIPFLAAAASALILWRRLPPGARVLMVCAIFMLLSVLPARINLGVRHILPIYAILAIPAGIILSTLLRDRRRIARGFAAGLIVWTVAGAYTAYPNYLGYFNAFVGSHPESVRVDSDLDWGQDVELLARRLRVLRIEEPVGLSLFATTMPERHGFNKWYYVSPWSPAKGWVAVSVSTLMLPLDKPPAGTPNTRPWWWLAGHQPVERVGSSILLYHLE